MKQAKVSLEQWQAFKAVVDEGSFSKAAEALNKSQSTISYAVSKLEEQLPTPVLTMEGRKAVLTEQGKVLYRKATQLLELALNIEQTAIFLADGWESQLTIDIDSVVPVDRILQAINEFIARAPQTRITLLESTLSGTVQTLLEKKADIVITGHLPTGFLGPKISKITMLPVAHANHPLARSKAPLTQDDLEQYRQIVVRDSGTKRNLDAGWLGAEQRLTVSSFYHSLQALISGIGFAFVPDHLVENQLKAGKLKKLNITGEPDLEVPLYLLKSVSDNEGPAVAEMTRLLEKFFK